MAIELKDALDNNENLSSEFQDRLVTGDEKNALVGTDGTPGNDNRYVTNSDARLSDDRDPNAHTHGSITDDGKVGSTADLPLKTGTDGVVEAGAFGSSAGQFAQGNDSRFPTTDEKAALAGSGTPSASSKYITEDSTKDITTKELLGHSGDVVISGTTLTFENGILKSVAV